MPLKAHFLNVGRGDCTIIEFPSGRVGIIDIDNLKVLDRDTRAEVLEEYHQSVNYLLAKAQGVSQFRLDEQFLKSEEAKLTDPLAYFDTHVGRNKDIFRFIVTHPDMDHMTGLYRLHRQDSNKNIINFWHTGAHDFNLATTTAAEWEDSPYDKRDWDTYKELRDGQGAISLQKYQGDSGDFWTAVGIEIWAPTVELEKLAVEQDQCNLLSYIFKIAYRGVSIVLGGDATEETWEAIYPHLNLSGIAILKASHHGRKTGYYGPAVKEMAPWLTITSVGEAAHDATQNYRQYSQYTVSLRKAGDVCITINDDGKWYYPKAIETHWKSKKQ